MANLDFYALGDDLRNLITFIYTQTDAVIFELSSEFDREPRQFRSLSELEVVFNLGAYRAGHLQIWSPSVMKQPVFRRVTLRSVPGHTFRYAVEGAGLMQLYLDGIRDGVIYHTHYGHWNEAGARRASMHPADDCDWRSLAKLSGRIQRHIRGKLAGAKLYARPVLHHAFQAVLQGDILMYNGWYNNTDMQDVVTAYSALVPPQYGSEASGSVTNTSATLSGTANPEGYDTEVYFQYGVSGTYGATTGVLDLGSGTSNVSFSLPISSGLNPNTTYYYQLVMVHGGNYTYGAQQSFTTQAYPAIVASAVSGSNVAATFQTLCALPSPLSHPQVGLISGTDGNFYGTASVGQFGHGVIYQMTPAGVVTTLVVFTGTAGSNIGDAPLGLISGSDGNLYGITAAGGTHNFGTIFKVSTTGSFTSLASFTGSNGKSPVGSLFSGTDGNFYGATNSGGANNAGEVFEVTPSGALSVLHSFSTATGDGYSPQAGLISGTDGRLYGTTAGGGNTAGDGTVYSISYSGSCAIIAKFNGTNGDGSYAPLTLGTNGVFYGSTIFGGGDSDGNIFKMTVSGTVGTITSILGFTGNSGASPGLAIQAALCTGTDGNFYGTTPEGGVPGRGNIFKLTPSGTFTNLLSFTGSNGVTPYCQLIRVSGSTFYGTTSGFPNLSSGTVFKVTSSGSLTTLATFESPSTTPGGLTPTWDGTGVVGTAFNGGTNGNGLLFNVTATGSLSEIASFTGPNGEGPQGALVLDGSGNYWGATQLGGANSDGSVFRSTASGAITSLYSFTGAGTDGAQPHSGLASGTDANFYGTTYAASGTNGFGTIFRVTPSGVHTTLVKFTGTNGSEPTGALLSDGSSNFYGTTSSGGANGIGSVFKFALSGTTGVLTRLYSFVGSTDGYGPQSGLAWGPDGNLYGTAAQGGSSSDGTIFKITPSGTFTSLLNFTGTSGASMGQKPVAPLTLGADGNFYGITSLGGASNYGTLFQVTLGGVLTNIWSFTGGTDGANPAMTLATNPLDSSLYGASNADIFHTDIARIQASLTGTVNPAGFATTAYFQYGLNTSYGFQTVPQSLGSGTTGVTVMQPLSGLVQGTTYHFQLVATNVYGTSMSPDLTISGTSSIATPAVVTGTSSSVGTTTATLNGSINPNGLATTYSFRYGTEDSNFPTNAVAMTSGTTSVPVTASVSGLSPSTTYYYHVAATNALGTVYGVTQSFTTP